jgi:hypothetical protein
LYSGSTQTERDIDLYVPCTEVESLAAAEAAGP